MNYLKEYQQKHGLIADGEIGKNTATVMMKDLGNFPSNIHFSHFIAQVEVESANFTAGRENLNYGGEALASLFGKYFPKKDYIGYIRKPEKIANRVYAYRMGNGDELSGDGWKYRGAGALQLTGKNNIGLYFSSVGLPPNSDPELLITPEHYFRSAVWFFDRNGIWEDCGSKGTVSCVRVSKAINLGSSTAKGTPNGLEERIALTNKYFKVLT